MEPGKTPDELYEEAKKKREDHEKKCGWRPYNNWSEEDRLEHLRLKDEEDAAFYSIPGYKDLINSLKPGS